MLFYILAILFHFSYFLTYHNKITKVISVKPQLNTKVYFIKEIRRKAPHCERERGYRRQYFGVTGWICLRVHAKLVSPNLVCDHHIGCGTHKLLFHHNHVSSYAGLGGFSRLTAGSCCAIGAVGQKNTASAMLSEYKKLKQEAKSLFADSLILLSCSNISLCIFWESVSSSCHWHGGKDQYY